MEKHALKTVIWGACRGGHNVASACLPYLQGTRSRCTYSLVSWRIVVCCWKIQDKRFSAQRGGSLLLSTLCAFLFLVFMLLLFPFFAFLIPSLFIAFCSSLAFLFLPLCVVLFPFLSFCSLVYFFALLYSCILVFWYIYNIINKISIISFVCARTRTRTTKARQNKAQKKGRQKSRPLHVIQKST